MHGMRRLVLAVGFVLVCAGCGGGGSSNSDEAAPASSAPVAVPAVPRPSDQQVNTLLASLSQVDVGLAANRDRAVSRSRDICLDIKAGTAPDALSARAVQRFAGGSVPTLTADQGAEIVAAVRSSFCA